jgi:hypothetical protein
VRHVADRMPDRGKRGKDIAIFADGAGCLQKKFGNPELRYVGNDQAVLAHSGLLVARSQVSRPATRSELTRTRGYAQCFLDLGQSTPDGRTVDAAVTMVAAASVTMLDLI